MNLSKFILVSSNVPILLTCVYAIRYYQSFNSDLRAFAWYIFATSFIQGISVTMWAFNMNNMITLNVYINIGFLLLLRFYSNVLKGFISTRVLWVSGALFCTFNLIYLTLNNAWYSFNSASLAAESILIIILALSTFVFFLNHNVQALKQDRIKSLNWINSGLFIYFASNILLFYFGEIIMNTFTKELSRYIWILHALFSVIMYGCFLIGLWKRSPR